MKIWISALVGLLVLIALSCYSLIAMVYEPFMFFGSTLGFRILILGTGLAVVWVVVLCLAIAFRKKLRGLWIVMVLVSTVFPFLHYALADSYMTNLDYNMERFEFKLKK